MVRLVFRPYTQVKRTICTSVSLRASTRVSPGFTLLRHSSPSFGSQQICSYSNLSQANDRSMVPPRLRGGSHLGAENGSLYFHCAPGFATRILAHMLDSLVRVSRRVNENHFVSVANTRSTRTPPSTPRRGPQSFAFRLPNSAGVGGVIPTRGPCCRRPRSPARGCGQACNSSAKGQSLPCRPPSPAPKTDADPRRNTVRGPNASHRAAATFD